MSVPRVITGDCLEVMPTLDAESVDAIVTDPPYGLKFMGKQWDHGVPGEPFWREALRVAKPGAHLVAFGGTRTFHRLTCAIEDAGWEIRDCLSWLYGSGFPKSHNGPWGGTALKPGWEPIVLARKPLAATVEGNHATHGTGALNINGCRLGTAEDLGRAAGGGGTFTRSYQSEQGYRPSGESYAGRAEGTIATPHNPAGRWPANVVLDEEAAGMLDEQSGERPSGGHDPAKQYTGLGFHGGAKGASWNYEANSGGASRFFYTSKAGKAERWEYLSCNCEATTMHAWENEDRSPHDQTAYTLRKRDTSEGSSTDECSSPTSLFGSEPTDPSRPDSRSTTGTRTSKTTASTTSGSSAPQSTSESTPVASCATEHGGSLVASAESSSPSTATTGISRVRAGRSTGVAVPVTSRRSSGPSNCAACGKPLQASAGHPTVKPLDLMQWLCRLVTPKGGLILDPFTGSGSTGRAAIAEGFRFVGIELSEEYAAIARARIAEYAPLFGGAA